MRSTAGIRSTVKWLSSSLSPRTCSPGFAAVSLLCFLVAAGTAHAQPDLTIGVSNVRISPTSVSPGERIAVAADWTARDQGNAAAKAGFTVGIYLGTERLIALLWQSPPIPVDIAPKETYSGSLKQELTIPKGTSPGKYIIWIVVDNNNLIRELNEDNNWAQLGMIAVVELPDLVITGTLTATPTSVAPGGAVQLSAWTVSNQGSGPAGGFTSGYYLSADAAITTADTPLGSETSAGLAVGGSQSYGPVTLAIPSGTAAGSYYIGILVDSGGVVSESSEGNNSAGVPITVAVPTGPDLTIGVSGARISPTSVSPGETIAVAADWAAGNQGNEAAKAGFTVGIYLGTERLITRLWESDPIPIDIRPKESYQGSLKQEVTIPKGTSPGKYIIWIVVDNNNLIRELNEDNNWAQLGMIAVVELPDLVITGAPTVTPTSVVPGGAVQLSAWTVSNQGSGPAGGFTSGYYLSTDAAITSADTLLGTEASTGLTVGASQSYEPMKLAVPAGMAAGEYYLGILVDNGNAIGESNEANNYVSVPIKVGEASAPDLVISVLEYKISPSPLEAGSAARLTGAWILKNQGTVATRSGFSVAIYLSTSEIFSLRAAVLLGEAAFPESLGAGQSLDWTGTIGLMIPSGMAPGRYWLFAMVDSRREITESNEANNLASMGPIAVIGPQADLLITSGRPEVTPSDVAPGGTVQLSGWTVKNQGTAPSGSFGNGFFLSIDEIITAQDLYLTGNSNTSLGPGESFAWGGPRLTIPVNTRPGSYYLGILVDVGNTVAESEEGNNYVSVPVTVTTSCNYAIEPVGQSHGSGMEAGRVAVVTGPECKWTAASNQNWIGIKSGESGVGKGTVVYVVAANTSTEPRTGTLTVAGQTFTVKQAGGVLPSISSINPSAMAAGSPGFDLTLNGSNFVVGSVVRWNKQDRSTTFLGISQLRAAILASDVAVPGTADVAVVNPWSGISNTQKFTVTPRDNPVPTIKSISPVSMVAGGRGFKLTVTGADFVPGSKVRWNGADRETSFESSALLTAAIPATDIVTAGTAAITVSNPALGGGLSKELTFTVWPGICITDLSPNLAPLGGSNFKLTVFGLGLSLPAGSSPGEVGNSLSRTTRVSAAAGPQILWNGQPLNTVVVDSNTVTAEVPAALVSATGTAMVSVSDSSGTGGSSNSIPLPITVNKPAPLLSKLTPSRVAPASASFTLTAEGTNFVQGSKILWNGVERETTYVDSTQVRAVIPEKDIASAGESSVTVVNPSPGGGESNRQSFMFVPTLFYPRLVSRDASSEQGDDSEYTGIAVANLGAAEAKLTVTAFDKEGKPLSGTGITNPASVTIKPGQQLPIVDFQLFGSTLPALNPLGWFKMESTVSNTVGFFLMFNQSLSFLDGTDVSGGTHSGPIVPEIEDLGFTQIHVANPGVQPATVMFELYRSDGTLRASGGTRTLGPDSTLAEKFTDLFPGVTAVGSDYVRAVSNREVVLFEYLGKSGDYVEGLNGLDAAGGATTLYCPQYVVGGSDWRTTLSIINLDSSPGTVTLRFIGDDGQMIGSPVVQAIAGRGKIYLTDQRLFVDSGGELNQGFLEIKSDGVRLAGSVVFGDPGRQRFASALPLESTLKTSVVFSQLASNATYFTGVAILNPNSETAKATIEVYDQEGNLIVSTTEEIPALSRKSRLLTEYFPSLAGQDRSSGYIRVKSDHGIAGFALFGTRDLSALSAVPAQPAP